MAILILHIVVLLPVHVVEMSALAVNLVKNSNTVQTAKEIIQHVIVLVLFRPVKKMLTVKITQNVSYPDARKLVESRTPPTDVSYSSLLRHQSNSVRHISTQTKSAIPDKVPSSSKSNKKK